ncbi:MAG: sugar ABC transporter permease [Lachnospiraceae bacterium]|nr:sugar ABC transporter permease [Lachnospiraceae bacterium]
MKRNIKKYMIGYLLVIPMMLGCMVFYAAPFGMMVVYSLKSSVGAGGSFVGLENYEKMFDNEMFCLAFWNTFRFLFVGLPLILLVSYGIALMLKKHVERHKLLKTVLLFPYVMPVVGTVLLVEQLWGSEGILNKCLNILGLPTGDWLESSWAFAIMILLYLWKNTGYSVILLLAGLMTIPREQYAVAELEGAGSFQKFRYITTPQMWYSIFFALLFSMLNAFKCFREIFLIGGKHPNTDVYMLQHFINNSFENLNYRKLSVASVLLFLVVTVVIGIIYAWVRRKESYRT